MHTAVFASGHLVGAYVANYKAFSQSSGGMFLGDRQHTETNMGSTRVGLCWLSVCPMDLQNGFARSNPFAYMTNQNCHGPTILISKPDGSKDNVFHRKYVGTIFI